MSDPVVQQDNVRSLHDPETRYVRPHNIIKGFVLEVAQLLFYEGNPTGILWDPVQERTEITIVDKYSFNLGHVGKQPAVVANRGPLRWQNTSSFRQLQSLDFRTGTRTHTDLALGGAVLSCFSREGIEAENIAGYLFEAFQSLRDVLRKIGRQGIMVPDHLGFFRIEATSMGEEALVKADARPDISVVPVAISAMVQRRWSVTPRARKLQGINVRTSRSGTP